MDELDIFDKLKIGIASDEQIREWSKGEVKKHKYEGEKFAGQSDHVFIENGDIHGKKCSEYADLDKQWYIDLVYKRLEDFGIDARPSMFDEMF